MLQIFHRIIWELINFLGSVILQLKHVTILLRKKLSNYERRGNLESELKLVSQEVKRLTKTPSHIVVVLGNESISYKDLANLIIWCIAAGVSFISIYDYSGVLKKNELHLSNVISGFSKKYTENIVWGKNCDMNGTGKPNGTKNGFGLLNKTRVNIFSLADGKGSIVDITKQLCHSVQKNEIELADISQDLIDKMMQLHMGVPDPEVAVCCGHLCSTFGLLPWQIRVTEFVQLQSHHNISVRDFLNILYSYSKCEQRFGK